jgi:hypothetical protein
LAATGSARYKILKLRKIDKLSVKSMQFHGYNFCSGEQSAQSDLYRVKRILLPALNGIEEAKRWLAKALLIAQKQKAKTWELDAATFRCTRQVPAVFLIR